jgi:hypothetical protein
MPFSGAREMDDSYERIGGALGAITAVLVFIGCWIYCIAAYGFLLGVGLGWLPSGICAALAGIVVRFTWPLIALGIAFLAWGMFGHS